MLCLFLVFSMAIDVRAADQAGSGAIAKIVNILKDMVKQLQKESEEDEDTYEKMGCWCETNDKEKTKSIEDAQSRIKQLGTSIEELTQASSRLNTEIKDLDAEIAK